MPRAMCEEFWGCPARDGGDQASHPETPRGKQSQSVASVYGTETRFLDGRGPAFAASLLVVLREMSFGERAWPLLGGLRLAVVVL